MKPSGKLAIDWLSDVPPAGRTTNGSYIAAAVVILLLLAVDARAENFSIHPWRLYMKNSFSYKKITVFFLFFVSKFMPACAALDFLKNLYLKVYIPFFHARCSYICIPDGSSADGLWWIAPEGYISIFFFQSSYSCQMKNMYIYKIKIYLFHFQSKMTIKSIHYTFLLHFDE